MHDLLSSLPTEILLLILEFVDDNALYYLALLCRRLNLCALSIYLPRKGILPSKDLSTIDSVELTNYGTPNREGLRAIRVSVSNITLRRLYYRVNLHPHWFPGDARHIYRLLQSVSRVQELSFDFTLVFSPSSLLDPVEELRTKIMEWHTLVLKILDIASEKGCRSLTFCGQPVSSYDPSLGYGQPDNTPTVIAPLMATKHFAGAFAEKTLKSALKSPVFPAPHILLVDWIRTMRPNTLTKLNLQNCTFADDDWKIAFNRLDIPSLKELSTSLCYIPLPTIVSFLHRHPSIQTLYLGDSLTASDVRARSTFRSPVRTSHLTSLTAHPVTICELLSVWPEIFTMLEHVGCIAHIHSASDFQTIIDPLLPVADAIQGKVDSLILYPHSSTWLGTRGYQPLNPSDSFWAMFRDIPRLEINAGWAGLGSNRDNLSIWLSQFSSLRRLDIVDHATWTRCSAMTQKFTQAVRGRCQSLCVVTVNGQDVDANIRGLCQCYDCWQINRLGIRYTAAF